MKKLTLAEQLTKSTYRPNWAPCKTFLNVPYSDKDQARALGAKWDGGAKKWFVPTDTDLNKFKRWLTK
jgi:putative DNA primase/helicase